MRLNEVTRESKSGPKTESEVLAVSFNELESEFVSAVWRNAMQAFPRWLNLNIGLDLK